MTSKNDVINLDFHQTCRICLVHQYLTTVQVHLNKFISSFDSFSVLAVQYGPGYIFSTYFNKNAVNSDFCIQMIPFFQETCKTKLN